eukprot:TRINITY_DN70041_c0_g1_i1.p1 TRINITY_DN70041_c0_g1~~TRINITY_DN70041_c0_g1_i1.p1  ORF type:complete len:567 (+),score=81.76 TRINITY_DN70041_c0_g1_i1:49-1749(+)
MEVARAHPPRLAHTSAYVSLLAQRHDSLLRYRPLAPAEVQVGLVAIVPISGPEGAAPNKRQWLDDPTAFIVKKYRRKTKRRGELARAIVVDGRRCDLSLWEYYHRSLPWTLNYLQLGSAACVELAELPEDYSSGEDDDEGMLDVRSDYGPENWTEDGWFRHGVIHVTLRRLKLPRLHAVGLLPVPGREEKPPVPFAVYREMCGRFLRRVPASAKEDNAALFDVIAANAPWVTNDTTGNREEQLAAEAAALQLTDPFVLGIKAAVAAGGGHLSPRCLLLSALRAKQIGNPLFAPSEVVTMHQWDRKQIGGEEFLYMAVSSLDDGIEALGSVPHRTDAFLMYNGMESGGAELSLNAGHISTGPHDFGPGIYGSLSHIAALYYMHEHLNATYSTLSAGDPHATTTGCVFVWQLAKEEFRRKRCCDVATSHPELTRTPPAKLNWQQLRSNSERFVKTCQCLVRRPDVVNRQPVTEYNAFVGPLCKNSLDVRRCVVPEFFPSQQLCLVRDDVLRECTRERFIVEFHYPYEGTDASYSARRDQVRANLGYLAQQLETVCCREKEAQTVADIC